MTTTAFHPRPDVQPAPGWSFPASETTRLANGVTTVAFRRPGQHLVSLHLLLSVPLSAEPRAAEGVATIAVSALDEGSGSRDAQAFAVELRRRGAGWSATAGEEGLRVRVDVPARHLGAAARLLAEAAMAPAFAGVEVDRLVRQRLDAIRLSAANPVARARRELMGRIFDPGSRLSRPAGGSTETVAGLDRDVVEAFYLRHADPALATVVLAGDVSAAAVDDVAEAFADWTPGRPSAPPPQDPAAVGGARVVVVDRPGAVQTQLSLGTAALDRRHPDWSALTVATHILGGTLTSRIDAVLREEKGYTYGTRATLEPSRRGGAFAVAGAVQTEVTGAAVGVLLGVLRTFVEGGVRQAERDDAVNFLRGVTPLRHEVARSIAEQAVTMVGNDLPLTFVDAHLTAMGETTAESAMAAFRRHVEADALTLVAVGDAARVAGPLEQAGCGPVEIVPV